VKNGRDIFGHDAVVLNPQLDTEGCIYVRYTTSAFKAWVPVTDIQRDCNMKKRTRRRPKALYVVDAAAKEEEEKKIKKKQQEEQAKKLKLAKMKMELDNHNADSDTDTSDSSQDSVRSKPRKRKREASASSSHAQKRARGRPRKSKSPVRRISKSSNNNKKRTLPLYTSTTKREENVKQDISSSDGCCVDSSDDLNDIIQEDSDVDGTSHVKKTSHSDSTTDSSIEGTTLVKSLKRMLTEEDSRVVGWLPQGDGFIIRDKKKFIREVLSSYFRLNKWSIFQAKLFSYGFHIVERGPNKLNAFRHELFRRGLPERYTEMRSVQPGKDGVSKSSDDPNFPVQLMNIVDEEDPKIIDWTRDGDAFIVFDRDRFSKKVLPKYSHSKNKLTSFQRQLKVYGFVNEVTKYGTMSKHPKFLRGRHDLCKTMKKKTKKMSTTQLSTLPFPQQLMELVTHEPDDIVDWTPKGNAFRVYDEDRLLFQVLPNYDTMKDVKQFEDFIDKLKRHGFKRIRGVSADVAFKNELFRRDKSELCLQMNEFLLPPPNKKMLPKMPFPKLLMRVLTEHPSVIKWNLKGESFSITDEKLFAKEVLPRCSIISDWKDFRKKLKLYGFTRGKKNKAYKHDQFKRDKPDLCRLMKKSTKDTKRNVVSNDVEERESDNVGESGIEETESDHVSESGEDFMSNANGYSNINSSDSESTASLPPIISLNQRPNLWSLYVDIDKYQSISKIKMFLPQEFHCRSPYIAEFFLFCHEWQLVWDRKRSCPQLESWSKDEVLSSTNFFMPSLFRELNKEAYFYHSHMLKMRTKILKECESTDNTSSVYLQEALWASLSFRLINRLETFQELGGIPRKNEWNKFQSTLHEFYSKREEFDDIHNITLDSYISILSELQAKNRLAALSNNLSEAAWSSHINACLKTVQCFTSDLEAWDVISDLLESGALYMSGRDGHVGPEAKGKFSQ
jgi:hypothetical protein